MYECGGQSWASGLDDLASRHSLITDIRGRGLLWGFEFTTKPGTYSPPDSSANVSVRFVELCVREGLIVYPAGVPGRSSAIIVSPPLVISESEVRELLARLDAALEKLGAEWPAMVSAA